MRIFSQQLKGMKVQTVLGVTLGKLVDIVIQTEDQLVAQYHVRSGMFGGDTYIVSRDQVVRFEKDVLVVLDGVTPVETTHAEEKKRLARDPNPVIMREE